MSFHASLDAALAPGSLCPRRMDSSTFCDFHDFDLLQPATRELIAANYDEIGSMRRFPAISGHFTLTSLLQITQASAIGTILREPRARVLSLYMYWRIPKIFDHVLPYSVEEYALKPLAAFLSESRLAPAIDNQVCRMLLYRDPRIPCNAFIAKADVEEVAVDAIKRLDTLGFVGVLELGSSAWEGLARLFGVRLDPRKVNVTAELGDSMVAQPREKLFTADAIDLIEKRNAADRIVYDHALEVAGIEHDERPQFEDAAFHAQLSRTQDPMGDSYAKD
ncbi:MAG TPA: hypothetical protein VIJ39_10805 [Solirubrobacteraceae bacterium]